MEKLKAHVRFVHDSQKRLILTYEVFYKKKKGDENGGIYPRLVVGSRPINTKNKALSKFSLVCTVVSVTFIVSYFHYILHPKSDWMVKYLNTTQQKDAWLKIYRHMQLNSHIGAALGIVAVALYANSVCPYTAE